MNHSA